MLERQLTYVAQVWTFTHLAMSSYTYLSFQIFSPDFLWQRYTFSLYIYSINCVWGEFKWKHSSGRHEIYITFKLKCNVRQSFSIVRQIFVIFWAYKISLLLNYVAFVLCEFFLFIAELLIIYLFYARPKHKFLYVYMVVDISLSL